MADRVPMYWGGDVLKMLALIASLERTTIQILADAVGVSRPTVKRYLKAARATFGVSATYCRDEEDGLGTFVIDDWGVLDGAKVVARFQRHHGGKDV